MTTVTQVGERAPAETTIEQAIQESVSRRCHDEFPDHEIEFSADKLRVIAEAHRFNVGGAETSPVLMVSAINVAEALARSLVAKAKALGVLDPDAPESV